MTTVVDTNVLLDIVTRDPHWFGWTTDRLADCLGTGPLLINDVIYAEMSVGYRSIERLEPALRELEVVLRPVPTVALFAAGKAFAAYRRMAGTRTGVLPDFLIEAHAAALGCPVLTRDPRRFRTCFPEVRLIIPA